MAIAEKSVRCYIAAANLFFCLEKQSGETEALCSSAVKNEQSNNSNK